MDNTTIVNAVAVLVAFAAIAAAGWMYLKMKQTGRLRSRFGPEYDRLAEVEGKRGRTEKTLHEREKRVQGLNLVPLTSRGAMQKPFFMFAMIVLVMGVSVQAQKRVIPPISPPTPFDQTISIEDELTGSFLVFQTVGGKYQFTRCADGFTMGGVGSVKFDGCTIHFGVVQADHRVAASVDECTQEGKALVEKFEPVSISSSLSVDTSAEISSFDVAPFKMSLADKNIGNNLMDCGPKK